MRLLKCIYSTFGASLGKPHIYEVVVKKHTVPLEFIARILILQISKHSQNLKLAHNFLFIMLCSLISS